MGKSHKKSYTSILALLLSAGLVFSFGLHAVQIEHTHFDSEHTHTEGGESVSTSLGEYMHLADKKLLILPVMGLLFWLFLIHRVSLWSPLLKYAYVRSVRFRERCIHIYRALCHLALFFGEGVLHSKVH